MKKTGAGYYTERPVKRSKIRYGVIENNGTDLIVNLKMIHDHVAMSRSCRHTTEDFMKAMKEFADNPAIKWDRPNAKKEFIEKCEAVWLRKAA